MLQIPPDAYPDPFEMVPESPVRRAYRTLAIEQAHGLQEFITRTNPDSRRLD